MKVVSDLQHDFRGHWPVHVLVSLDHLAGELRRQLDVAPRLSDGLESRGESAVSLGGLEDLQRSFWSSCI